MYGDSKSRIPRAQPDRHPEPWGQEVGSELPGPQERHNGVLLGLPCAYCRAYLAVNLEICPICGSKERVSLASSTSRSYDKERDIGQIHAEERRYLRVRQKDGDPVPNLQP